MEGDVWTMHAHLQTGEFIAALGFYDIIHAMQLFADHDDEVRVACTCPSTPWYTYTLYLRPLYLPWGYPRGMVYGMVKVLYQWCVMWYMQHSPR